MAKKETTRKKKNLDDSIPLMVCVESRIDMGIERDIKACRDDKPELPRRAKKKTTTNH